MRCFTFSEDNEAVNKMINKGRILTMRHVSRTHRVAFDWSIYRINLDPKIQIKYFDTRNQHADILTKDIFTRDEWHHFLRFFNIVDNSVFSCSQLSNRIDELSVMSMLLLHAHLSSHSALTTYFEHFSCVSHARMAQASRCQKGSLHVCHFSIHLAFSLLMCHPSLLFLDGHFETTPDYDFTNDPVHTFLPHFPVLKAQDTHKSAHSSRSLGTWPSQMQTRKRQM